MVRLHPPLPGVLELEPKASHALFQLTNQLEDTYLSGMYFQPEAS